MQDTISRLFITGGTVNAPTATVGAGINPSAPLVFYVDVATPNTASVTLNVVGLGQGVVLNAAGNPLAAGEWLGRVMLTRETDGRYRIMNDPASALSAALSATQAGTARDAAQTASSTAQTAKTDAETARTQAQTARTDAQSARDAAIAARNEANTAKTDAQAARDSAATSAVGAATSASNASGSATAAGNSASAASTSATNAGNSATAASGSAGTATTQADRAKTEADRAEAAAGGLVNAVQFVPQTLTEPQKTQARNNIGVSPVNASTVGAALATPTPSETIEDGDRLSGLDPSGTGLKLFRFSAVKAWIQTWLTKAMVGLGNVANKSEAQMVASGAIADALAGKLPTGGTAANSLQLGGETAAQWQAKIDALPTGGLGIDQTWQNVLASRSAGTSYQNTSGKPICVNASFTGTSSATTGVLEVSTNGSTWIAMATGRFGSSSGAASAPLGLIVQNGMYYRLTLSGGASLYTWTELS